MDKTTRLLRLMQLLRSRRQAVTAQALAQALGVSLRTVYRDIQALVQLGASIDGSAGVGYLLYSTALRHIKVTARDVAKFDAIGRPLFKADATSLYISAGKRYDCIDFCRITVA